MVRPDGSAGTMQDMSETAHRSLSGNGSGPAAARPAPPAANPWPRRVATTAVLLLAAAILAYGCSVGESAKEGSESSVIVAQYPAPGGRALRQTEVGAELEVGYDGRLTVNGVAIPEEDMEGAVDPSTVSEENLQRYGIRPQNRNRVIFRPGPGKVIEELEPGEVTITLRWFPDRREDQGGGVVTWTITVV